MSLTENALRERKWGSFQALRQVLEDKRLPDHYFGFTSASDNFLSKMDRVIDIALLTREFRDELLKTANTDFRKALHEDLAKLEYVLKDMRSFIDAQIENIKSLRYSL